MIMWLVPLCQQAWLFLMASKFVMVEFWTNENLPKKTTTTIAWSLHGTRQKKTRDVFNHQVSLFCMCTIKLTAASRTITSKTFNDQHNTCSSLYCIQTASALKFRLHFHVKKRLSMSWVSSTFHFLFFILSSFVFDCNAVLVLHQCFLFHSFFSLFYFHCAFFSGALDVSS